MKKIDKTLFVGAVVLAAVLCFVLGVTTTARAENPPPEYETAISAAWCKKHGGTAEYRLSDNARVDCLLPYTGKLANPYRPTLNGYAVEHDWGHGGKVYECLGQAAYYAAETGLRPLCVLIRRTGQTDGDFAKYARRAIVGGGAGGVRVICITTSAKKIPCLGGGGK